MPNILIIDDDVYFAQRAANFLTDRGKYVVRQAHTVDEAIELIKQKSPANSFSLIVMDISMPPGSFFDPIETEGGHKTGVALTREVRNTLPEVKLVINTSSDDHDLDIWFADDPSVSFIRKTPDLQPLLRAVDIALNAQQRRLRSFIVHGRDRTSLFELKLFLQKLSGLAEPMVLSELPSLGKTVIEKFEHYAVKADVVFVLLTPDDTGGLTGSGPSQARTRQNVIFELGYFFGSLRRQSGRVFLLHRGELEIASDLAGVIYISIDHGIEAAGEQIRRELGPFAHS